MDQKQDGENSNLRIQAASLDTPQNAAAIEHKKGYMLRKCCFESNYRKSKKLKNSSMEILLKMPCSFLSNSSVRKTVVENVLLYVAGFSTVFA